MEVPQRGTEAGNRRHMLNIRLNKAIDRHKLRTVQSPATTGDMSPLATPLAAAAAAAAAAADDDDIKTLEGNVEYNENNKKIELLILPRSLLVDSLKICLIQKLGLRVSSAVI